MKIISIVIMLQVVFSCNPYPGDLERSLELSGENRSELEKVLNHYSDNSLKYQASEYLIRYMPYYSFKPALSYFEPVFDSLAQVPLGDDALRKLIYIGLLDSVANKNKTNPELIKYDIQEVSADYLIENIDLAFEAWLKIPIDKRANFQTFCDYILPYRNWDEPLEAGTRRYLKEKYNWIPRLLNQGTPMKTVIDSVLNGFHYRFVGEIRDYYPNTLSISQFDRSRQGLCQDAVTYYVNVFRSVGLVCSNEFVPQYGNHHYKGHSWLYFKYGDQEFALDAGGDGVDIREKYDGESVPKVYRRSFGQLNPSSLFCEGRDVSAFYIPVIDFELKSDLNFADTTDLYTVNVYHNTKGWSPIAEMEWLNNKADQFRLICRDLGVNSLYIAGRYDDGMVVPVTAPFFVDSTGGIHKFRPMETLLDSVKLLRKYGLSYPRSRKKVNWMKYLNDATIQGAQNPAFARADTLFKIKSFWSTHLHTYPVLSRKTYRFVRLVPAQEKAYLAELAFYDHNGQRMEGELISENLEAGTQDGAIFDGNPLTWTGGKNFYIGFEFDQPQVISKLSILTRNDDNHIRIGDEYELQYWDRSWKSLGTQEAQDTVLYYNQVPKNALLILRNHTRGSEEIPFRLNEQKEQVWMGFDNY